MIGYCIDIHVKRGGNMFYIKCEVLNFCVVFACCVYIALIYLVVKLSYELIVNSEIYA